MPSISLDKALEDAARRSLYPGEESAAKLREQIRREVEKEFMDAQLEKLKEEGRAIEKARHSPFLDFHPSNGSHTNFRCHHCDKKINLIDLCHPAIAPVMLADDASTWMFQCPYCRVTDMYTNKDIHWVGGKSMKDYRMDNRELRKKLADEENKNKKMHRDLTLLAMAFKRVVIMGKSIGAKDVSR